MLGHVCRVMACKIHVCNLNSSGFSWLKQGASAHLGHAGLEQPAGAWSCWRRRKRSPEDSENRVIQSVPDCKGPRDFVGPRCAGNKNRGSCTLARRSALVGLTCPAEPTCRAVLAAGVAAGIDTLSSGAEKYAAVLTFKRLLKLLETKLGKAPIHLVDFSLDPRDLPECLLKRRYQPEDPPKGCSAQQAETAGASIKVRKSAKELRAKSAQLALLPASSGQQPLSAAKCAAQVQNILPQILGGCLMNRNMLHMLQRVQLQNAANDIRLQMLSPRGNKTANGGEMCTSPENNQTAATSPKTLMDKKCAAPSTTQVDFQATSGHVDSQGSCPGLPLETQIVDDAIKEADKVDAQIQNRKVMKKPAGKQNDNNKKAAAKKAVAKKPAGHGEKRPAMPGKGAGTTWYNGGKIHRSDTSGAWRVFIHSGEHGDMQGSWAKALNLIDEGQ